MTRSARSASRLRGARGIVVTAGRGAGQELRKGCGIDPPTPCHLPAEPVSPAPPDDAFRRHLGLSGGLRWSDPVCVVQVHYARLCGRRDDCSRGCKSRHAGAPLPDNTSAVYTSPGSRCARLYQPMPWLRPRDRLAAVARFFRHWQNFCQERHPLHDRKRSRNPQSRLFRYSFYENDQGAASHRGREQPHL